LVEALRLEAHPEGGWYRQTWRAGADLPAHGGMRAAATSIVFLLLPGERSRWHRVRSEEMWFWQGGGRLLLSLGGAAAAPAASTTYVLGPDPAAGDLVQCLVPGGVWQAAEPLGDAHVLVGCVVAPGFDFADFELAP
jgi:predicted cupin superfamily sugar epimerase